MELLHWGPLAQVITKGGTTVNQEIMPAYAAYQKAIDLTLYHAFAELVVQTSQDDKARMHYRQIEAAQIWQQDVDVSIYFEQYTHIKYILIYIGWMRYRRRRKNSSPGGIVVLPWYRLCVFLSSC